MFDMGFFDKVALVMVGWIGIMLLAARNIKKAAAAHPEIANLVKGKIISKLK